MVTVTMRVRLTSNDTDLWLIQSHCGLLHNTLTQLYIMIQLSFPLSTIGNAICIGRKGNISWGQNSLQGDTKVVQTDYSYHDISEAKTCSVVSFVSVRLFFRKEVTNIIR